MFGEDKLEGHGKLDQFPLNSEKQRLVNHKQKLSKEELARLLINPCTDDSLLHFAYEDKEAVIVPITPQGQKSVKVYVLQRTYLVQERKSNNCFFYWTR